MWKKAAASVSREPVASKQKPPRIDVGGAADAAERMQIREGGLKRLGALPIKQSAMSNPVETHLPRMYVPIAPDRRKQDRILTTLPMRILGIEGKPVCYPGVCTNLSRGGIGFETSARRKWERSTSSNSSR